MIRVGICEDEAICRKDIGNMLERYFTGNEIEYQLKEYESGNAFMKQNEATDILILDIEMEGITGIQLKDWLGKNDGDVKILFVTNHMEKMPEAFGKNVYGFLNKPVEWEEFIKYLNRMAEDTDEFYSYLVIKGVDQEFVIRIKDILYFVSEDKYSRVITTDNKQFCDKSLGQWENELTNHFFFRCHKRYLVNFRNISTIDEQINMNNGQKIPVSRRKRKELNDAYLEYIIRKAR